MKSIYNFFTLIAVASLALISCQDNSFSLDIELIGLGTLHGPENNFHISIDPESNERVDFNWSAATSGDGGLVLYRVLFDREDGDFQEPIASFPSSSGGSLLTLMLSQPALNNIASAAGIGQLATGKVRWTVEASSGYNKVLFPQSSLLSLTRPEGIANLPDDLYIFGPATEGADLENGIAFKRLSNQLPIDDFVTGIYESITYLKPGEFQIADRNAEEEPITYFHINEEGRVRTGDQNSTFNGEEGVYRIRLNLTQSRVTYEKIDNIELYILANGLKKAELSYKGNHTFESNNGYFEFLNPGHPEAPDWLGWEEERYRFRLSVNGETSYIGSNQNDDMNGSLVPNLSAYNGRPNGSQPPYYHQVFFLGSEASHWQGAWKFSNQFNKVPFTVRIVFDPKADNYYHEFELN
ncbi:SusE domain-containing protein [Anditalea andensis]|uniref:SusE outer membrane protein domain-containing protein n=1 Tax=Anditalea andensis TaxID=1048983 RepID=A0A074KW65_9BACT|nr:SusE domain-containing protein [Anditalea andensis]KEO71863.1 hypothetical protein EL17_20295 [Anditalea andensis]